MFSPRNIVRVLIALPLIACVCIHGARAQTTVGGVLTTDTHWSLSGSPYIVSANVLVDSNVTLRIDPGVIVRFDANRYIKVLGTLIADGTEAGPIRFTSNKQTPAREDWGGLRFDTHEGTVYDNAGRYASGSILRHAYFEYANTACYIAAFGVLIERCSFSFNAVAVQIERTEGMRFINCDFDRNNLGISVPLSNMSGHIRHTLIRGCTFRNHTGPAVHMPMDQYIVNDLEITRNQFFDNDHGITLGGSAYQTWVEQSRIAANLFLRNKVGMWLPMVGTHSGRPDMVDLTIENNIIAESGQAGLRISHLFGAHKLLVQRNVIVGNPFGVQVIRSSEDGGWRQLKNNLFVTNEIGVEMGMNDFYRPGGWTFTGNTFVDSRERAFRFRYGQDYTISGNNFIGGNRLVIENLTQNDIQAPGNFWGFGRDSSQVAAQVYDYYDEFEYGKVLYGPIASTPVFAAPIAPPRGVVKESLDGATHVGWQPSPEPTVIGYRVYWGTADGITYEHMHDAGMATDVWLDGIPADARVAVTAYTANATGPDAQFEGEESWFGVPQQVSAVPRAPVHAEGGMAITMTPHPVSGAASVAFTMERAGHARVEVFNLRGEQVAHIADREFAAGMQQVAWSGRSDEGAPLPSGLYICRIETGNVVVAGRFLVVGE